MTLNTHMAVLGKTNGRKMEYTSTAGTEKEEEERRKSSSAAATQIPPSDVDILVFLNRFQPRSLSARMYIRSLGCDSTCRASRSCCRQGCWVGRCCCRAQSGSLVPRTIHGIHAPEAGTAACGPGACRTESKTDHSRPNIAR